MIHLWGTIFLINYYIFHSSDCKHQKHKKFQCYVDWVAGKTWFGSAERWQWQKRHQSRWKLFINLFFLLFCFFSFSSSWKIARLYGYIFMRLKITSQKERKGELISQWKLSGRVFEARNDSSFIQVYLLHLFLWVSGDREKKIKKQRVGDFPSFVSFSLSLCSCWRPVFLKRNFWFRQAAIYFFCFFFFLLFWSAALVTGSPIGK